MAGEDFGLENFPIRAISVSLLIFEDDRTGLSAAARDNICRIRIERDGYKRPAIEAF